MIVTCLMVYKVSQINPQGLTHFIWESLPETHFDKTRLMGFGGGEEEGMLDWGDRASFDKMCHHMLKSVVQRQKMRLIHVSIQLQNSQFHNHGYNYWEKKEHLSRKTRKETKHCLGWHCFWKKKIEFFTFYIYIFLLLILHKGALKINPFHTSSTQLDMIIHSGPCQ